MIRIHLDTATRTELQSLRRTTLPPRVRDRLEMVLLSDAGWSPPRIARHLASYHQTVRDILHAFRVQGRSALFPGRTGPAPDLPRRDRILGLLRALLGQERTWTSAQLADALRPHGVDLGDRQVRRYLRLLKAGYRRTASTLKHKQDPAKVARAKGILDNLRDKAAAGRLQLYYLDESGFAPSLPVGYRWALPGERKRVPYEYPQGRRVNVLASYAPYGPVPWLDALAFERTLTNDDLLTYLKALPWAKEPRVVVLDNASRHVSKVVKAQRRELARLGIYLYFLPPYSPELNEIEPVFKQVKHHEIPKSWWTQLRRTDWQSVLPINLRPSPPVWSASSKRSHTSKGDLRESVDQGFTTYRQKLHPKPREKLRPAA